MPRPTAVSKPARLPLLLLALLGPAALAQGLPGLPATGSPLSSIFDKVAGQAEAGQPASTPAAPVSDRVLTYKPSAKVSADLRKAFIDQIVAAGKKNGTLTAATEKEVRDSFGKIDIAAEYGKFLKPKGYDVYNVVTAMTLYVVSSFEALDDLQTTDAQDRATYEQFKRAFAGVPAVAKMTDADKQKFSEALMWLTAFQGNDVEQAKKGTSGYSLEAVKDQIKTTLRGFKIDPDRVKLGAKGLQARE